jgi:hypothetical protein
LPWTSLLISDDEKKFYIINTRLISKWSLTEMPPTGAFSLK